MEVGNPRIDSTARNLDFLRTNHGQSLLFLDRFRQRTSKELLQILRKRRWFPRNARIHRDSHTTHLSRFFRREKTLRHARDFLVPHVLFRSPWRVSRFFRNVSAVWNIVVKLSDAEYRRGIRIWEYSWNDEKIAVLHTINLEISTSCFILMQTLCWFETKKWYIFK